MESRDRLRAVASLPDRERIALIRTVVDGDKAADVAKARRLTSGLLASTTARPASEEGGVT